MVRRITILHLVPDHRIACFALYKRLLQHCKVLPTVDSSKKGQAIAPESDENLTTNTNGGNSSAIVVRNETKVSLGNEVANLIAKTFRKNRRNRTTDQVRELLKQGYEAEQALSKATTGDADAIGKIAAMLREEHRKGQKPQVHASAYRKKPLPPPMPGTEVVVNSPTKKPLGYEQPIKSTLYHLEKQGKPVVIPEPKRMLSRNVIIIPRSIAPPKGDADAMDSNKTPRCGLRKMRIPALAHAHGIPLLRYPGVPQSPRLSMMIRKKGRVKNMRHIRRDALKSMTSLAETEDDWDELVEQTLSDPEFTVSTTTATSTTPSTITDDTNPKLTKQQEDGNEEDIQECKWIHEADNALAYVNSLIVQEAKRNFDKGEKLWAIVEEKRRQRDVIRAETKRLRRKRYRDGRRERDETFGHRKQRTSTPSSQQRRMEGVRHIRFPADSQKQIRQKREQTRTSPPKQMTSRQERPVKHQTQKRPFQKPKDPKPQKPKEQPQPPRPGGSFSGRWV